MISSFYLPNYFAKWNRTCLMFPTMKWSHKEGTFYTDYASGALSFTQQQLKFPYTNYVKCLHKTWKTNCNFGLYHFFSILKLCPLKLICRKIPVCYLETETTVSSGHILPFFNELQGYLKFRSNMARGNLLRDVRLYTKTSQYIKCAANKFESFPAYFKGWLSIICTKEL
jgi:hypothetical protein